MPPSEGIHEKLSRVRTPRVHIKYKVQTGDAIQEKELPFVVGVLADLSGKPEEGLGPLKKRKFTEIDRDTFNTVLAGMKPRLAFQVDNKLQNDGTKFNVELKFSEISDFEPEQVVRQVEPLRQLLAARERLSNMVTKLDGNDKLDQILQDVINNTDALKKLSGETGRGASQADAAATPEPEPSPPEEA